ncbi:MAG: hypothetical protein KAV87_16480, partial [Desulfobacteraceae bacterium]|nr:hypothetical protein [Desulfobacteraceae bacterium]
CPEIIILIIYSAMHKRLSIFFIFLLIFASTAGAFHHHDDGLRHDDCSVCTSVSHNTSFVGQDNSNPLQLVFNDTSLSFQDDASLISFDITTAYSERAPPA